MTNNEQAPLYPQANGRPATGRIGQLRSFNHLTAPALNVTAQMEGRFYEGLRNHPDYVPPKDLRGRQARRAYDRARRRLGLTPIDWNNLPDDAS